MKPAVTLLLLLLLPSHLFAAASLRNDRYQLDVQPDHSIRVTVAGAPPRHLSPSFVVMRSEKNPGLSFNHRNYYLAPRNALRWSKYQLDLPALNAMLATPDAKASTGNLNVVVTENGKGRTWVYTDAAGKQVYKLSDANYALGTTDVFLAGDALRPAAKSATVSGNKIRWTFADAPPVKLSAEVELPPGDADPIIRWIMTPAADGYYSVVFTGSPQEPADDVLTVPQECLGRNYRQFNHVVNEADLKLPRAQVATEKFSSTLVIDPAESRFGLPNRANSRFGMMIERKEGQLRPVAIAPLIGGVESKLKAGTPIKFAVRYVLKDGEWKQTLWHVARDIYAFRDMRDNSGPGSLNTTLERVIDYLADRNGKNHAMWNAEEKYFDYWADKTGVFKPFSPIFGLTAAVVTDDADFYRRRALPAVEFALSRKSNVFSPFELKNNGMISNVTRELGGPYVSAEQLVTLHDLFARRTPAFATYAEEAGFANGFVARLAKWRLTGNAADLAEAVRIADSAVAKGAKGNFMDWLELYEASPKPAYLDVAVNDAYRQASNMNLSPPVPNENVTMDKGGKVPIHIHAWGRQKVWGFAPPVEFSYKEQTVPAWRPALTGLISDAYRGGLWMNDQGSFMRLALYAKDDFLHDLSRWGMVGRFGNWNGDNRSALSLITESPDAIESPMWKLTYSTINPGHAWEFAGEVIDFIVSDATYRSAQNVKFPGGSMNGSSFQCTSYGGKPGEFYGEKNVTLWLPRKLLGIDNKQIDYLAGFGNDRLYLAMWNQSFKEEKVVVQINGELADVNGSRMAKVWQQNKPAPDVKIENGAIAFTIPPRGIVAYAIAGVKVKTQLAAARLSAASSKLGASSVNRAETPFGHVNGMILSMGEGLTNAFIYTDAPPEKVIAAKLRFRQGGPWQEKSDVIFPYEFSLDYDPAKGPLEYVFEVQTTDAQTQKSATLILKP